MWKQSNLYEIIEKFMLTVAAITMVMVIPLLTFDHFVPVSSGTQAIYCVIIVGIGVVVAIFIAKRRADNVRRHNQSIPDRVEVIQVKTTRAVKRKDFDDFGVAFYIDVTHEGKQKTLFLWGQYLDELEYRRRFPNSEFEIVRVAHSEEFITFKPLGRRFKAERVLPAFDKQTLETGAYPVNGQLIDMPIDAILQ